MGITSNPRLDSNIQSAIFHEKKREGSIYVCIQLSYDQDIGSLWDVQFIIGRARKILHYIFTADESFERILRKRTNENFFFPERNEAFFREMTTKRKTEKKEDRYEPEQGQDLLAKKLRIQCMK